MSRRYGQWAGYPNGHPKDPARCIHEVYGTSGITHQCSKKRGHGEDGLYCKQHDPEAVKARWKAQEAEAYRLRAIRQQNYDNQKVGAKLRDRDAKLFERLLKGGE